MTNQKPTTHISVAALYLVVTLLFWLCVVGVVGIVSTGLVSDITNKTPPSWPATVSAESLGELPWDAQDSDRVAIKVPVSDLSVAQVVVFRGAFAIGGLLLLFTLWKLRQLVRSVRDRDPFTAANTRRLRVLGLVLIFWHLIGHYLATGISEWIITTRGPDIPTLTADVGPFPLGGIFAGLCLLVLAEVFAHGIRLREDVEATI